MIQVHELVKVTVNRTYRDNLADDFNGREAVYEFAYEYSNGAVNIEQLVFPVMMPSQEDVRKLASIKDFLIEEFKEVPTPSPFESMKTYVRKGSE